jgi:dTDP-4-amino-4,6-dideoxygalactose transaminase
VIPVAHPLAQYQAYKDAIDAAMLRVVQSGRYILGAEVEAFERAFARYCHRDYAIGVASGTDALILALKALGIGPGAEVITVSHTAVATVAAVLAVGATPVLVDVDPIHYTLDPAALEVALTKTTKAVIAVHLYGQAADMGAINSFASRHGLSVIEDCAQAVGGSYKGRQLGSLGDSACFSFYPTKNLGALGDGGMVVTSDAKLAGRVRQLRQYGWDEHGNTHGIGVNSRLDELQAAILAAKLLSLDADNARRAALAARYAAGLVGLPLRVPATRSGSRHVFHLYVIACDERGALKAHLASAGITTGIHYPLPVHRQDGYTQRVHVPARCVVTERLVERILSLPLYPELQEYEVDRVVTAIRAYYRR